MYLKKRRFKMRLMTWRALCIRPYMKQLQKRLNKYDAASAPALALTATMEKTTARFANYGEAGLLCGSDGLPHLIVDGRVDTTTLDIAPLHPFAASRRNSTLRFAERHLCRLVLLPCFPVLPGTVLSGPIPGLRCRQSTHLDPRGR
jgi:hypothetical protein